MDASSFTINLSPQTSCCAPNNTDNSAPAWLKQVDVVCRVALGTFAVYLAPIVCSISLSVGLVAGAAYTLARKWQQLPLMPFGESKPVCAQGYMDYLSGMRFPPLVGNLATATFIAAHMRHDPQFYVPFCGIFIGFWLGREAVTLAGRAFSYFKPSAPAPIKTCCHCV